MLHIYEKQSQQSSAELINVTIIPGADTIKAMLWQDKNSIKPLRETITLTYNKITGLWNKN